MVTDSSLSEDGVYALLEVIGNDKTRGRIEDYFLSERSKGFSIENESEAKSYLLGIVEYYLENTALSQTEIDRVFQLVEGAGITQDEVARSFKNSRYVS